MRKAVLLLFCILYMSISSVPSRGEDVLTAQIDRIEKSYFGYDYPNEGNLTRLERLEKAVYGSVSTMNQTQRVQRLYRDLQTGTTPPQTANVAQAQTADAQEELPPAEKDVKYPVVDKIEQKVLKKTYVNEDIYLRLSRLEKQVFKKESNTKLSLSERVDNLRMSVLGNSALKDDSIALDGYDPRSSFQNESGADEDSDFSDSRYNYYTPQNTRNRIASPSMGAAGLSRSSSSDPQSYDVEGLESSVLGKKFSGEPIDNRLARLENSVFQKTFNDNEDARVQRLLAATTAQKTAGQYDNNKMMQRLNTGMQIGGVILMILAMIL